MNSRILALATLAVLAIAPASLIAQGGPPPLPPQLPPLIVPPQNPITAQKAVLGKILFWDEQLSSDNTVACGTCHFPEMGGGDARLAVNPGFDGNFGTQDDVFGSHGLVRSDSNNDYVADSHFGVATQVTGRTAPTMIAAAYAPRLFWDGRAGPAFLDPITNAVLIPNFGALEAQAVGPIVSDVEMAHQNRNWNEVTAKLATAKPLRLASNLTSDIVNALAANPTYPALFANAFGSAAITPARIAFAIATYERTLIPNQTPFDAFAAGNPAALTPNQHNGFMAFNGGGQCNVCHDAPFFTNHAFRNVGLRPVVEDTGRFAITNNPGDLGRFKVPSLRNAGLRNRFMHNGEFTTLQQVVNFYINPGNNVQNRDPAMNQINIQPNQIGPLVDFLTNALTDPRVAAGLPPFDRPTLYSESNPGSNPLIGTPSVGTGGLAPTMLAQVPANLGNSDFKIGLGDVGAPTLAFFALSPSLSAPGTQVNGLPIYLNIMDPAFTYATVPVTGSGAGNGCATIKIPIPDLPVLSGLSVYAEWFVLDNGALSGLTSTSAAQFTLF